MARTQLTKSVSIRFTRASNDFYLQPTLTVHLDIAETPHRKFSAFLTLVSQGLFSSLFSL
jgi:hypothetical protein